jgi:hypothetical protein
MHRQFRRGKQMTPYFTKPILMKCGHVADTIMTDVPYHDQMINIAACSFCFDQFGTAIQPACNMAEHQPKYDPTPLPKIKRNRALMFSGVALLLVTIIALIVSI